jgi:Putative transposase
VTFRYKDYADGNHHKTMTLWAEEFLRRFVQHVLPRGFVKIRHYGLLANRRRGESLPLCRRLLLASAVAAEAPAATAAAEPAADDAWPIDKARQPHCPHCGSCRLVYVELSKEAAGVSAAAADTS